MILMRSLGFYEVFMRVHRRLQCIRVRTATHRQRLPHANLYSTPATVLGSRPPRAPVGSIDSARAEH